MSTVTVDEEVVRAPTAEPSVDTGLLRRRRLLVVLLLVVTGVSMVMAGGHSYAIDNEVQFQTTRSLVNLRPDLTELDDGWAARSDGPYRVRDDGTRVAIVPIGQSILSAPFYVASRAVAQLAPSYQRDQFVRTGTFFTNSLLLGLTAVVVALLAIELGARDRHGILLGYVYGLGTYALPNAKTYFTEIGASLFVALACLLAARAWQRGSTYLAAWSGVAVGAAFMVRPSSALFVPVIGVVLAATLWRRHGIRRTLAPGLAYGIGAIVMIVVNGLFSWWRFGSPVDLGYQKVYQNYPLLSGLTGQTWSLGKGLIFYAPIVLCSAIGAALLIRRRFALVALLAGPAAASTIFFARVPFWAGDNAWGPRYTLIIVPLLVPLAAPLLALGWGRWAVRVTGVLGVLGALLGCMVNFNTVYIEATRVIGVGGETPAIHNQLAWQPFVKQVEFLPDAFGDVIDPDQVDEVDRGGFTRNPDADYGYFGVEPRIDVWWLWMGPTDASGYTWLFVLPIAAMFGAAGYLLVRDRRVGQCDELAASAARYQSNSGVSSDGSPVRSS